MKIQFLWIISFFLCSSVYANIYFWESDRDGARSCCLFVSGQDFCVPYQPCTRNAFADLTKISDYIARIFVSDKGTTFSYHKLLQQAQDFIKYALSLRMPMYYRFDVRRKVKFFHEIAETVKTLEKPGKSSSSTSSTTSAAAEKQKNEDIVLAYLVQHGLAWPMK